MRVQAECRLISQMTSRRNNYSFTEHFADCGHLQAQRSVKNHCLCLQRRYLRFSLRCLALALNAKSSCKFYRNDRITRTFADFSITGFVLLTSLLDEETAPDKANDNKSRVVLPLYDILLYKCSLSF